MKTNLLLSLATCALATVPEKYSYHIVFHDDFTGNQGAAIDHSRWKLRTGKPTENNGEVQEYRDNAANVHYSADNQLLIVPTKENGKWYSGRVESWYKQNADQGKEMIFQAGGAIVLRILRARSCASLCFLFIL